MGVKVCTSCNKTKSIGQFTKGWSKCKRCHEDASDDSSDDDTKKRCKKLEKRVKKLEKTVEKLCEMLEDQHTKTFGIEKMIQGVALGVRLGSANVVELDD